MRWQVAAIGSAVVGLVAILLLAAGALIRPAGSPATPATLGTAEDRPVYTSIRELMQSIVDPSADVLWGSVGTVVDKEKGIQELSPKTREEWLNVRRAAVRIVEAGNLLLMPGREAAPAGAKSETPGVELEPAQITALVDKDRKSFDDFAKALRGVGLKAVRASDAKDADLLMDAGARMENVCESCHQTFWYPNVSAARSPGRSTAP